MKILIGLFLLFTLLSCKKQPDNILTTKDWVLESATVNPAMTIGNKTSTDYKNLLGPGSCLSSNYTLKFNTNGTFNGHSNGALCDLLVPSEPNKWSREGNMIRLLGSSFNEVATLADQSLTYTSVSTIDMVIYTTVYIFRSTSPLK
jgi:hypothetical protein